VRIVRVPEVGVERGGTEVTPDVNVYGQITYRAFATLVLLPTFYKLETLCSLRSGTRLHSI
jgi:hypothetical protein